MSTTTIIEKKRDRLNRRLMSLFFIAAGSCHFLAPPYYISLIPEFLPDKKILVNISGGIMMTGAAVLWYAPKYYRSITALFLTVLLLVMAVVHIEAVSREYKVSDSNWRLTYVWFRLLLIQPILIFWTWSIGRNFFKTYKESPFAIFSVDPQIRK